MPTLEAIAEDRSEEGTSTDGKARTVINLGTGVTTSCRLLIEPSPRRHIAITPHASITSRIEVCCARVKTIGLDSGAAKASCPLLNHVQHSLARTMVRLVQGNDVEQKNILLPWNRQRLGYNSSFSNADDQPRVRRWVGTSRHSINQHSGRKVHRSS